MAKKKQYQHIDMQHNEVQNAKEHILNATPEDVVEGQHWYDSVSKRPKYYNGTSVKDYGKEYTDGTGIDITNEVISVEDYDKILKNESIGEYSLIIGSGITGTDKRCVVIGKDAKIDYGTDSTTVSYDASVVVGYGAKGHIGSVAIGNFAGSNTASRCVSIGSSALCINGVGQVAIGFGVSAAGTRTTAIGSGANASSQSAIAIGDTAKASATNAIQIGKGTNSTANTLAIGFGKDSFDRSLEYILLDGSTGKIPNERISLSYSPTSGSSDPITSGTVYNALGGKQDALTFSTGLTLTDDTVTVTDYDNIVRKDGTTGVISDDVISSNIARISDLPTTASDVDALPDTTKYASSIDLTINSSTYVITAQLKDQDGNNIGTAKTIDLPLESVVVSGSYDSSTKEVILTLKDGSTIDFSVADLISGLQSEITSSNKLSADLVDDSSSIHKFATSAQLTQIATNQTNIGAINTTLSSYGNIVTHNASEFATSAQGSKADTALQSINKSMVTNALGYTPCKKITADNTDLTASGGQVTWTITNSIGSKYVGIHVYETSTGEEIECSKTATANTITIKMNSTTSISANTYYAVIIG